MSEPLEIWTVYDRPRDWPHTVVARKFLVGADGAVPTTQIVVGPDLEAVREQLREYGLTCLARNPDDDPKIVETWL